MTTRKKAKTAGDEDREQLETLLSSTKAQLIRLSHSERIYFEVSVEENPSCQPVVLENWDALTTLINQRYDDRSKTGPHKIDIYLPLQTLKVSYVCHVTMTIEYIHSPLEPY